MKKLYTILSVLSILLIADEAVSQESADLPVFSASPFINEPDWKVTGTDVPVLKSFQETIKQYMGNVGTTAGALAVTREGRLLYAQGYTNGGSPYPVVKPSSLFRIASLSKSITAVAVLKLIEMGTLKLDTSITEVINFDPLEGQMIDPGLHNISISHLLHNRGGWDKDALGYDPMFNDFTVSEALEVPLPVNQQHIIKFMSGVQLNFEPGTEYAYSNYGYMLLGRVIEVVSGQSYENFVTQSVLKPLGMNQTRLGQSLPEHRSNEEVLYESDFTGKSVFDTAKDEVSWPNGGWNLENMDAHGGWVSSVIDMAKFMASFDSLENHPVLSKDSIQSMFSPPVTDPPKRYYAKGWQVVRLNNGQKNIWHSGSLDGTLALMVRRYDGVSWVAMFNKRDSEKDPSGKTFWEIDRLLHKAADSVNQWPEYDLFNNLEE